MNKLLVLLSLSCTALGGALGANSPGPGQLVSYGEVEQAMGACGDFDIVAVDVCSPNCGFTTINRIVAGTSTIDPAVQCGTVTNCTAPQTLSNNVCSS